MEPPESDKSAASQPKPESQGRNLASTVYKCHVPSTAGQGKPFGLTRPAVWTAVANSAGTAIGKVEITAVSAANRRASRMLLETSISVPPPLLSQLGGGESSGSPALLS